MKSGWIGRFYLIFDCVIFVERVYIYRMTFFVKNKIKLVRIVYVYK